MRLPVPGDRIELVAMSDDPDPISAGTKGMINFVRRCGAGREAWLQIDVNWDNGRQLMLAVPPDEFVFLSDGVKE